MLVKEEAYCATGALWMGTQHKVGVKRAGRDEEVVIGDFQKGRHMSQV